MSRKKKEKENTTPVNVKDLGKKVQEIDGEDGEIISIYKYGNSVYFVSDNKILNDLTIHIDDIENIVDELSKHS